MGRPFGKGLIQVRTSDSLHFCNPDVNTVFDVSRSIYARDYSKIREIYQNREIPASLRLVIGTITESQQLINYALGLEQKGGQMDMCNALEELRLEGLREGRLEGIRATIRTCKKFNISEEDIIINIMKEFSLSQEDAANYVKEY